MYKWGYGFYRYKLEKIHDRDQLIRQKIDRSLRQSDVKELEKLGRRMEEVDKENLANFDRLFSNYGWPLVSEVGKKASSAAFYVVQHASLEVMRKYFPLLEMAAAENEADRKHVAMMRDRILMYQGKKQIYGTQAFSRRIHGTTRYYIWPIADYCGVNERRRKIGFDDTLENSAKKLAASTEMISKSVPRKKQLVN